MKKEVLRAKIYLNQTLTSYKKFMRTEKMPTYELIINDNESIQGNIAIFASHNYNVKNNKHELTVSQDIYKGKKDYILFHELTHMYDVVNYSVNNTKLYFANRGFTEYHAGQIEFLKLLGAATIEEKISFSLKESVTTVFGDTTVLEYILNCRNGARQLISEVDFPNSINSLSSGIAMIFNHLGRVSMCRLYAIDYEDFKDELENMDIEILFLGDKFLEIMSIAKEFLKLEDIKNFGDLFSLMAVELFEKFEKNFK